jgi:hypothetical protein
MRAGSIAVPIAGVPVGRGEVAWFFASAAVVLWPLPFAIVAGGS